MFPFFWYNIIYILQTLNFLRWKKEWGFVMWNIFVGRLRIRRSEKNWIHERATKRAGFDRFPTVTIFEKISNLVFVRRTLYIHRKIFFSIRKWSATIRKIGVSDTLLLRLTLKLNRWTNRGELWNVVRKNGELTGRFVTAIFRSEKVVALVQ